MSRQKQEDAKAFWSSKFDTPHPLLINPVFNSPVLISPIKGVKCIQKLSMIKVDHGKETYNSGIIFEISRWLAPISFASDHTLIEMQ